MFNYAITIPEYEKNSYQFIFQINEYKQILISF